MTFINYGFRPSNGVDIRHHGNLTIYEKGNIVCNVTKDRSRIFYKDKGCFGGNVATVLRRITAGEFAELIKDIEELLP